MQTLTVTKQSYPSLMQILEREFTQYPTLTITVSPASSVSKKEKAKHFLGYAGLLHGTSNEEYEDLVHTRQEEKHSSYL